MHRVSAYEQLSYLVVLGCCRLNKLLHLVICKLVEIIWQSYLNTFLHPLNILVGITITELYDSIQRNRSIL